jgi:hypothetical protein
LAIAKKSNAKVTKPHSETVGMAGSMQASDASSQKSSGGQGFSPLMQPLAASHVAVPVQNSPSSHALSLGTWSQALAASLQESTVQAIPSLQWGAGPA